MSCEASFSGELFQTPRFRARSVQFARGVVPFSATFFSWVSRFAWLLFRGKLGSEAVQPKASSLAC